MTTPENYEARLLVLDVCVLIDAAVQFLASEEPALVRSGVLRERAEGMTRLRRRLGTVVETTEGRRVMLAPVLTRHVLDTLLHKLTRGCGQLHPLTKAQATAVGHHVLGQFKIPGVSRFHSDKLDQEYVAKSAFENEHFEPARYRADGSTYRPVDIEDENMVLDAQLLGAALLTCDDGLVDHIAKENRGVAAYKPAELAGSFALI